MGNAVRIKKVNFEDIQHYIEANAAAKTGISTEQQIFLINTLSTTEQGCLIPYTLPASEEEATINRLIKNRRVRFIIYGRNSNDPKLQEQYEKLYGLGFTADQIYVYAGGLFEWLLLQDVYGKKEFPTTSTELDLLKYKAKRGLF